jgi:hypothetical protein
MMLSSWTLGDITDNIYSYKKGEANMKCRTRNIPVGFTGTLDDMIYYTRRPNGRVYARRRFTLKDHPSHKPFANATRGIYALNPSREYRQNLADYMIGYNRLEANEAKPAQCWNNLYNKLMFAMQRQMGIPLATLTRQMITDLNLPCRSVKNAVEAGLLPMVKSYERFGAEM